MSLNTISFFKNVTTAITSEIVSVANSKYLQLDVSGTANNFKINVYAQVIEGGDFLPLAIIGNSSFKIHNSINTNGFYRIDTSGILNIRLVLEEISNGDLTCYGEIVRDYSEISIDGLASEEYVDEKIEENKNNNNINNIEDSDAEGSIKTIGDNEAISEHSSAIGYNCTAGVMGYYWYSIDFETNQIVLTKEQATEPTESFEIPYSVGDKISIINGSKYEECSTITAIVHNVITVDTFPFTEVAAEHELDHDCYSIHVPAKPALGEITFGYYAHAEGFGSQALEMASHAEGRDGRAIGQYSHAEGRGCVAYYAAHAEGKDTKAKANCAHTEGIRSVATANCAHAEGADTSASGYASHAEGSVTEALGSDSHAEGYKTKSIGVQSHAEGLETQAKGGASHAEGRETQATATCSHAEGVQSVASGYASHAEGSITTASGGDSHAEGNLTFASGNQAHAEGNSTKAIGVGSHAEGQSTEAQGNYAHAEGCETCVEATSSGGHSEGANTRVTAYAGHAEGYNTLASGMTAHAEGSGTQATAEYAHAEGKATIAQGRAQHVEGEFNLIDTEATKPSDRGKYIHIAGNGTSDTARSNAYTLDWDGNGRFAGNVTVGKATTDEDDDLVLVTKGFLKSYVENAIKEVLNITESDEGKFLKVVNGKATWVELTNAEEAVF